VVTRRPPFVTVRAHSTHLSGASEARDTRTDHRTPAGRTSTVLFVSTDRPRHARLLASDARKRGDVDALLQLLSGTDQGGRQSAVYNLGEMRAARAVTPLVRCLQANDVILRVGALKALAKIGDRSVAADVFDVATNTSQTFGVRMEAASALASLGDPRGAQLIRSMLWATDNPYGVRYRRWAAKRLAELLAIDAIPDLEEAKVGAGLIGRWRLRRAIKTLRRVREGV
jgi:HEAT repeat protein